MCQYISILRALSGAVVACAAAAATPAAAQSLAITHVTVVDPVAAPARDMTVVIRDGKIVSIAATRRTMPTRGMRVFNGRGKYLIPGLWDMHVHIILEGGSWALGEYVAHGITGVRDMGGRFETVDSLRRAVDSGRIPGPRILAVGPQIEHAGSMEYIRTQGSSDVKASARWDRLELLTPDAATRAVDSLVGLGVDFIKGRNFADTATYWAIANAARRGGRMFVGHPPIGIDPIALADSGQRTIEHWYYPDDLPKRSADVYRRIVDAYIRNGTAFVPTLSTWSDHRFVVDTMRARLARTLADSRAEHLPPALLRHWTALLDARLIEVAGKPATVEQLRGWNTALDQYAIQIGRLSSAGVLVLSGSDLPFALYPGDALHEEMRKLVRESGLTPRQALATATIGPAMSMGMRDSLGTIAPGRIADLVLLDADPLADIGNVRRVARVMRRGQWVWAAAPSAERKRP